MSRVIYQNPDFVQVTEAMGERYVQAKTQVSWAHGVDKVTTKGYSLPSLAEASRILNQLHRAWPANTIYADKEFPALLDKFDAIWPKVMEEYQNGRR